jgi:hypothetical protein
MTPEDKVLEDKRFQPSARVLDLLNRTDAAAPKLDALSLASLSLY